MWYFNSPLIVFGEDALCELARLEGKRAFIVTDPTLARLGFVDLIAQQLRAAGLAYEVFAEVEPDPSLETVRRGAERMSAYGPDWIIGLGGGSSMDAAKAMWVLYEHPDMVPEEINPVVPLEMRQKARLITIPTTSGTGAETTWAIVLTDTSDGRKLVLGARENTADMAIVDPALVANLPAQITADTGMDALTHAVEGYTATWHNDFCDGLCLVATKLVFDYLPRAVANGADAEAREKMHNAATIQAMAERFADIVRFIGHTCPSQQEAPMILANDVRELARSVEQPLSLQEAGLSQEQFEAGLPKLIENAESDATLVVTPRIPEGSELERLFRYAFAGRPIDF